MRSNARGSLAAVLIGISVAAVGCSYPAVDKPAYDMAVALDHAIELQSLEQLREARLIIDRQRSSDDMTAKEHRFLSEIIATAQQGQWNAARSEVRQLLEDQVEW